MLTLLGLSLAGCETLSSITPWSGSTAELRRKEDPATVPVEELYNRGVDAMAAKRYTVASQQFDLVEQNFPYSSWAVNAQLMQGYSEYLQNQHAGDRHAGPLHPVAPGASRHRLCLLPARVVLL